MLSTLSSRQLSEWEAFHMAEFQLQDEARQEKQNERVESKLKAFFSRKKKDE